MRNQPSSKAMWEPEDHERNVYCSTATTRVDRSGYPQAAPIPRAHEAEAAQSMRTMDRGHAAAEMVEEERARSLNDA